MWKLDRLGRSLSHLIETAAVARGRKGGRMPTVTPDKLQRARALIAQGLTVREAAARIKVGKTSLYAALRADGSSNEQT